MVLRRLKRPFLPSEQDRYESLISREQTLLIVVRAAQGRLPELIAN